MDKNLRRIVLEKSNKYLRTNPERFTEEEIVLFKKDLDRLINLKKGDNFLVCGEVYDFFVDSNLIDDEHRRFITYKNYINSRYSSIKFKKLLDIGSGRMCKSSKILAKYGFEMYPIDPKIRLTDEEISQLGIAGCFREEFKCDEFSENGVGTDVRPYDLLCGIEPCGATEAGIRQALNYDKYFDFMLCTCPNQKSLDGTKIFRDYEEWYKFLQGISSEVKIENVKGEYYATNYEPAESKLERE